TVTDERAATQLNTKSGGRREQHARFWFPAVAARFRVMRAYIDGIQPAAGISDPCSQRSVDLIDLRGGGDAAPDSRLIGDNNNGNTEFTKAGQGFDSTRQQFEFIERLDVVGSFDIDRTITIDKDRIKFHRSAPM